MKVIAINASPRKTGNSAKMLDSWVEGYKSVYPDVEVERVDLYTLKYTVHINTHTLRPLTNSYN